MDIEKQLRASGIKRIADNTTLPREGQQHLRDWIVEWDRGDNKDSWDGLYLFPANAGVAYPKVDLIFNLVAKEIVLSRRSVMIFDVVELADFCKDNVAFATDFIFINPFALERTALPIDARETQIVMTKLLRALDEGKGLVLAGDLRWKSIDCWPSYFMQMLDARVHDYKVQP